MNCQHRISKIYQFIFSSFCREVVTADGRVALLGLQQSPPPVKITFVIQPGREFSIASVNLIKQDNWNKDFLNQVI